MENYKVVNARVLSISSDKYANRLTIKLENGEKEIIIISDKTLIYEDESFRQLDFKKIDANDKIFIFIKANTPMMMSYPPQYSPQLIIVAKNRDYLDFKLDVFDDNLVSSDNSVKINFESLGLVEKDSKYLISEMIKNQTLLVFYQKSTRSIPALINPLKIIILEDDESL